MGIGPVVLITGCSSGIGRDLVTHLAGAGYRVVATARRPESLSGLPAALKLPLDVERPESVTAAVEGTVEALGRVDVVVNNAGYGQLGPLETMTEEAMHRVFAVNVHGPLRLIQAVAPHMRRQGSGRIINLSSVAGLTSFPMWGAYCATKSALEAMSDALRLELLPFGIHVVVVEPPSIRTGFEETARTSVSNLDTVPAYREMYQAIDRVFQMLSRRAPGPEAVSRVVKRAIEARRPRARYQVTGQAVLAAKLLPLFADSLRDVVLRRVMLGRTSQ